MSTPYYVFNINAVGTVSYVSSEDDQTEVDTVLDSLDNSLDISMFSNDETPTIIDTVLDEDEENDLSFEIMDGDDQ